MQLCSGTFNSRTAQEAALGHAQDRRTDVDDHAHREPTLTRNIIYDATCPSMPESLLSNV